MDATRKANREGNEVTLQYTSQHEALLVEQASDDKLKQLLESVGQLAQTPSTAAELERRTKLFGECQRSEEETSGVFYARLRHWLDREIPQTKSPIHAPRQNGD